MSLYFTKLAPIFKIADVLHVLCAAYNLVSEKPLSSVLVRGRGFEPPSPCGRIHLKDMRLPVSPPAHYFNFLFITAKTFSIFLLPRTEIKKSDFLLRRAYFLPSFTAGKVADIIKLSAGNFTR